MISLMKVGQLWGHSCFKMDTRTRFNLFKRTLWVLRDSSDPEHCIMKPTTKFLIPGICQYDVVLSTIGTSSIYLGTALWAEPSTSSWQHDPVPAILSLIMCQQTTYKAWGSIDRHLACGYVDSCNILSTNNHASGSSLNYTLNQHRQRYGKREDFRRIEKSYLVHCSLCSFLL